MRYVTQIGRLAAVALPACLLMACSDMNVQRFEHQQVSGNDFNSNLARDYKAFTSFEAHEMYDWPDAVHFADKGMQVAGGNEVLPEDPANWDIKDPAKMAELQAARTRLMNVLNAGGRTKAPVDAAKAQQSFDCWVEEQEEAWQSAYIGACRDAFLASIAAAEGALNVTPPAQPRVEAVPQQPRQFLVFFAWDRSDLNGDARQVLDSIVAQLRNERYSGIRITGYADRSGPVPYNIRLSQRRADSVAAYLAGKGVQRSEITTVARGESDPLVPTADGVREPQNRRAAIVIQLTGAGTS